MTLTWYVADLKSGEVLEELPLVVTSPLERTVGAARTCAVRLPVTSATCPPDWANLLIGGRTMLVPVNDGTPIAGYLLTSAEAGGPEVPIGLTTLEAILDADYCPALDFVQTDESQVLADLVNDRLATQFGLTVDVTDCGKVSDHTYYATEDRRIGSAATELMSGGGPEWMVRVEWEDADRTRFRKVLQIAPEVGRRIEATVFSDEHVSSRKRPRNWGPEKYATGIQATGDGSGDSRPISELVTDDAALAAGSPLWVDRVEASAIDGGPDLAEYAAAVLQRRRYGLQTWELELATGPDSTPRVGVDFDAGDTVTMQLGPTRWDSAAWNGPARIQGWRASVQDNKLISMTPVFWQPTDQGVS